jgi:exosortase/archaeosortase family protein
MNALDKGWAEGGISRPQLIAGLYLVGVLTGFGASILQSIRAEGLWHALGWAFGISIVDVAATAVGVHLARQSTPTPLTRIDYVAVAVFALLILVPLAMSWPAVAGRAVTWAAVAGLAVYEMGRNRRCPTALAAASVFILLAASVIWGRVLAQVFAGGILLSWDAWLATRTLHLLTGGGVERMANVIITDHGSFVVSASCSSLRNVLYGLLCWLTVARALRPKWQRGDLLAALIVSGTVIAANTLRISLVGLSDESYEWFHGMLAENVFNLGLLLFTAAVALGTSRHQAMHVVR